LNGEELRIRYQIWKRVNRAPE